MGRDDSDILKEYLAARDVACPGCGYNLRGLTTGRCPECAEHLELRVASHDPRPGAFIAGIVALASGAGFSGLLLVYALVRIALSGGRNVLPGFLIIVSINAVIETLLLIAWLRYRSAFHRHAPPIQRLLVLGCWAVSLVNLIVFTALIR